MSIVWKKTPAGFTARIATGLHDDAERIASVWRTKRESRWRWTVRDGHNAILSKGTTASAAAAKMESVRPYNKTLARRSK